MEQQINEQEKQKLAQDMLNTIKEEETVNQLENAVKDNIIYFTCKEQDFRIRRINYKEQEAVEKEKRKKYLELISDPTSLFRQQWVDKYKEKGIDLDKMDGEIVKIQANLEQKLLSMVGIDDVKIIEQIKTEVEEFKNKIYEISVKKADYLGFSIEDQLRTHVLQIIMSKVLEKKEGENWITCFKTFEDFQKCEDNELMTKAFYWLSMSIEG